MRGVDIGRALHLARPSLHTALQQARVDVRSHAEAVEGGVVDDGGGGVRGVEALHGVGAAVAGERTAMLQPTVVEVRVDVDVHVAEVRGELVAPEQLRAAEGVDGARLVVVPADELHVEVERQHLMEQHSGRLWRGVHGGRGC